MADHINCFMMLRVILNICQGRDRSRIQQLREVIQGHQTLFSKLYYLSVKTKLHATVHIPDYWEEYDKLLGCFAAERYHKQMKKTMGFAFRWCTTTTLAYCVRNWFRHLEEDNSYAPYHFTGTMYCLPDELNLVDAYGLRFTTWGKAIQTPIGSLASGDLVSYKSKDHSVRLGFIVGIASSAEQMVCVLQQSEMQLHTSAWKRIELHDAVVVTDILGSLPYVQLDDDNFFPALRFA